MKSQNEIDELVDAILCLNQACIDMGESYSDLAEQLCSDANIKLDSWYDEPGDIDRVIRDAYMYNFERDSSYMWPELSEYYNERFYMILTSIATGNQETLSALEKVSMYEKKLSLNGTYVSNNMQKLYQTVEQYDISMIQFAYKVSHDFFRYLDPTYYFISNDCFTVGGVTVNGDDEFVLGQYVCHAEINGKNNGFTAAFKDGEISFYQYRKELRGSVLFMPEQQAELNIAISIGSYEEHEKVAKKIAEIFNNAASEFTKNIESAHDDNNAADNVLRKRRGGR